MADESPTEEPTPPAEDRRAEVDVLLGVISDTHGLLRDSALDALEGVDRIIHAGDVDEAWILERLAEVAPVSAVRGNVDRGPWAADLPRTEVVEVGDRLLYVLHDPDRLDLDPAAAGFDAVIHGHTHDPRNETADGVLYLNPGSAGRYRRGHPVTLALLRVPTDAGEEPLKVE
ncbi:MAG: metallophosphoesterase family protein, partial [Gemmatimonadota bacterium]